MSGMSAVSSVPARTVPDEPRNAPWDCSRSTISAQTSSGAEPLGLVLARRVMLAWGRTSTA